MGKDENSGVYTKREIPGHHKQNEANQIMETEEQRARRLMGSDKDLVSMLGWGNVEDELVKAMTEEISKGLIRELKRAANKTPLVSDKIKPIK
jgi:hypothetical protein